MDGAIIVGGQKYVIPGVAVHTWHDHGMHFDPPNAPRRIIPAHLCVVHWIAAERRGLAGAEIMFHNLNDARKLSVEFMIDNDGDIYQFVDPAEQRCKHCSRVNPYSVGVEVSGKGHAGSSAHGDTALREVYEARIHGWKTDWYDFLPDEYRALYGLADALTVALPIGRNVMTQPWGRRSNEALQAFAGFCGHLHAASMKVRSPKCDPGTRPLEGLLAHFA